MTENLVRLYCTVQYSYVYVPLHYTKFPGRARQTPENELLRAQMP